MAFDNHPGTLGCNLMWAFSPSLDQQNQILDCLPCGKPNKEDFDPCLIQTEDYSIYRKIRFRYIVHVVVIMGRIQISPINN